MRTALPLAESAALPGSTISVEKLRCALVWLMGFAGAFVFIEPSPYEVVGLLAMLIFFVTGLSLRAAMTPLVALLIMLNLGYALATVAVSDQDRPVTWIAVSAFLAATAIFYAAMLGHNTQARLKWLMRGYVAAAVLASLAAIAGFLNQSGALGELFLRYGRARGTFNDPNVLGAFLVLPGLLLLQRIIAGRPAQIFASAVMLLIVLAGLFLSFSRGAWGIYALCAVLLMGITFASSQSPRAKLRIIVIALFGALVAMLALAALLSIGNIAVVF
jgi:hypothetical protein